MLYVMSTQIRHFVASWPGKETCSEGEGEAMHTFYTLNKNWFLKRASKNYDHRK